MTATTTIENPELSIPPASQISFLPGPPEAVRSSRDACNIKRTLIAVPEGEEDRLEEINDGWRSLMQVSNSIPHPTATESFGTTAELFGRVRQTIAQETGTSSQASHLLTCWVFSTWLVDSLPLAPCLLITGSAHQGDLALRTLKSFCRSPYLLSGCSLATLKKMDRPFARTLLIHEPNLTRKLTTLISCSTARGYLVECGDSFLDLFCSKAIFAGNAVPLNQILQHAVQIDATVKAGTESASPRGLAPAIVQRFHNQLHGYRISNLVRVRTSEFDAKGLPSETRVIANALGACLVDAPELQAELVSLLAPYAEQGRVDRSSSLEAVTVEATLSLCHQAKAQVLVREITHEVNVLLKKRGEKLNLSPEKVGHALKKVNLFTRRLGKDGNGLIMDQPTKIRIHEVASAYLDADLAGVGLGPDDKILHCSLCAENKVLM